MWSFRGRLDNIGVSGGNTGDVEQELYVSS